MGKGWVVPNMHPETFLMHANRDVGVFTTYGIVDPRHGMFVYVGQTSNFAQRKRAYSRGPADGRKRPRVTGENIKTWTYDAAALGVKPILVPLETVKSWQESLVSESTWVRRLTMGKHPLLNKWRSHKEIIRNAYVAALSPLVSSVSSQYCSWHAPVRQIQKRRRNKYGRLLPENYGAAWTRERDEELRKQFSTEAGATSLAKSLGRSKGSVRARLVRLGCIADRYDLKD